MKITFRRQQTFLILAMTICGHGVSQAASADPLSGLECRGKADHDWLQQSRDSVVKESLFRFAIEQAGRPISCEVKDWSITEEGKFGTLVYQFKNGATYSLESSPPETLAYAFSTSNGFAQESKAISSIKKAAAAKGLHVDWTEPQIEKSGDVETKTFWDPNEAVNGRAFLSWKNGQLISIGYGMAL